MKVVYRKVHFTGYQSVVKKILDKYIKDDTRYDKLKIAREIERQLWIKR